MSDLSKELLSRADAIFGKIAEAVASAGTFAMEQLPDIALQFILYNRVMYTIHMLVGIEADYLGKGKFEYSTNRGAWFSANDFELVRKADLVSFKELDSDLREEGDF